MCSVSKHVGGGGAQFEGAVVNGEVFGSEYAAELDNDYMGLAATGVETGGLPADLVGPA